MAIALMEWRSIPDQPTMMIIFQGYSIASWGRHGISNGSVDNTNINIVGNNIYANNGETSGTYSGDLSYYWH